MKPLGIAFHKINQESLDWLDDNSFEFSGYFKGRVSIFSLDEGTYYAFICEGSGVTLCAHESLGTVWWSNGSGNRKLSPQEDLAESYYVRQIAVSTPWTSNPFLTKNKIQEFNNVLNVDHISWYPQTTVNTSPSVHNVGTSFTTDTEYVSSDIRKAIRSVLDAWPSKKDNDEK